MKTKNISPYRWVILFTTIPAIIATEMMWLTFSPISSIAETFYSTSSMAITMLATSYMLMFIVFCIPAAYVIDRFGFRTSLWIGALLTGIFGLTRGLFAESFTMVIISQFLIAAGQPFLLNITTKVAANWFPFDERATAAGLLTMAQYLGFALPMVLSPMLSEQYGLPGVLKTFAVVGVAASLLAIVFSREKPPVAPPGPEAEKEDFSLATLKVLLRNKSYLLAMIIAFISMGIFNTLLTLIESILMPRGITSAQAGIIGAAFVLAGVLGAIILPMISDRAGKRIPFLITAIILLVPLYLGMTMLKGFGMLVFAAAVAGFAIMGVAPILFQHGSEVAYPVQEGTSLGMILLMGQISGVLFVFLFEAAEGAFGGVTVPMLGVVILTALEIPLVAKMKESALTKK
ncbi:MFS transporter [Eubacteriales bacterium DFI.9.88]|nr:MFS transporter [Eubacteriales bacterium DFI.9.88]